MKSGEIETTSQRKYRLPLQEQRVSQNSKALLIACFLISLFFTLKMEAICSSETSIGFQHSTRCYIPRDGTLHSYRCENLKLKLVFVPTVITESFHVISPGIVS
jgi:hypothetical protein